MTNNKIIEIKNAVKDYGQQRGIFGVSFDVYKGECFGFLGPNGAGKSTTIRLLMGFSKPDSGELLINGQEVMKNRDKIMENVSYLPGEIALPNLLTGKDFLNIQKNLKNVINDKFLNYLIDLFELDTNLICKEMSLGMKRKLAIVSCFMSDPDIIIMDEPSSGLDPEMQDVFVKLIKEEKKRGKTILMSSHIFSEIDASADRIGVIKDGKIVSIFKASDLKHNQLKTYYVNFYDQNEYQDFKNLKDDAIKIINFDDKNKQIVLHIYDKDINKLTKILENYKISDFIESKETLEEYFMKFYKDDKKYQGL